MIKKNELAQYRDLVVMKQDNNVFGYQNEIGF